MKGQGESMGELDDRILRHLQSTHRPKSTRQVADAVGVSAPSTARSLSDLQQRGQVLRKAGGWIARSFTPMAPSGDTRSGGPAGGGSTEPSNRGAAASSERSTAPPTIAGDSRWLGFRKLCAYYADCVRIEERARLTAYSGRATTTHLELAGHVDWRALAAGQPTPLLMTADELDTIRRIGGRSTLGIFYLGAPVEVYIKAGRPEGEDGYRALTPPFVQRVVLERAADGRVTLIPIGGIEINHGWINGRMPGLQARQRFLDEIGLEAGSGDAADEESDWLVRDFTDATRRLYALAQSDFREFPDLQKRQLDPDLAGVPISGIYNRALLLAEPKLQYGHRLHGELLKLAYEVTDEQLDQSALGAIFPHGAAGGHQSTNESERQGGPKPEPVFEYAVLSDAQLEAVRSAKSERLTMITGPPGTGKSVTVAHIVVNAVLRQEKALFASRNHQALEAVEPRVNAIAEPELLMIRPTQRRGDDGVRFEWARSVSELLARPETPHAGDHFERSIAQLQTAAQAVVSTEAELLQLADLRALLAEKRCAISDSTGKAAEYWAGLRPADLSLPSEAQVERLEIRSSELERTDGSYLKRFLRSLLRLFYGRRLRRSREEAFESLGCLGLAHHQGSANALGELRCAVRAIEAAEAITEIEDEIRRQPGHEVLAERSREARALMDRLTREALAACASYAGAAVPPAKREAFATIRAALKNRGESMLTDDDELSKRFSKEISGLFEHFPLWAVTNLSVSRVCPLTPAVFDLAVIDEASQCDIPSALPVLFRARRAVIVGDPNQLSHVTKLKRDTEMSIRVRHKVSDIDYERFTFVANSLFDLVNSSRDRKGVMLADHYRCDPDIVGYCNDHYYRGALRVRSGSGLRASGRPRVCEWTHVVDDARPASSGCVSDGQGEAVMHELWRLADAGYTGTVGVVTPFRAQADRIRDAAFATLDRTLRDRWRLVVATADGFQGDEREVVLFSLVGGPSAPAGSMHFLAAERNRFNVAVSRARATLHVFGDRIWAENCDIPHVRALVRHIGELEARPGRPVRTDLIGPVWEPRLAQALAEDGITFEQQYPACGYFLDFAILTEDIRLNVEVDGERYHRDSAGGRRLEDVYRDQVLVSAGWEVVRFWVYELREDLNGCVGRIRERLRSDRDRGGTGGQEHGGRG